MPFVEAFRQFQFRVSRENFVCVHVSLIPQVPVASGVVDLVELGGHVLLFVCRC